MAAGVELVAEPINQVHPTHFGEHRRQHWLVRGDRLCDCEIHRLQRDEKASFPAGQFGLDLVKLEDLEVFNIQRVATVVVASTRVESVSDSSSLTSRTIEVRRERSADERSAVCWLSALVEIGRKVTAAGAELRGQRAAGVDRGRNRTAGYQRAYGQPGLKGGRSTGGGGTATLGLFRDSALHLVDRTLLRDV